jgi:phage terminase small subunit
MARKIQTLEDHEQIVDNVMSGMSLHAASRAVGLKTSSMSTVTHALLEEARMNLQRASNIRKKDVILGVLDAIDRARMAGEPNTEINGWKEVSKLMGFYAPEVKRIDLNVTQGKLKSKFEQMSDQELLEMASRTVIEGEYELD